MARISTKKSPKKAAKTLSKPVRKRRSFLGWVLRIVSVTFLVMMTVIAFVMVVNPPTTIYMSQESRRLSGIDHQWVAIEEVAPVMVRSVVAAEDANFCNHWGFDLAAIKDAIAEGNGRGASTISQQVVKNVYLWQGRNWIRKALEAVMTPFVEALWSKRRIVEVYLNVAEFDEGVFGVEAASRHYFSVGPEALSAVQAARLASVLPSPKTRNAGKPTSALRRRAAQVKDGAATIDADGRADCFQS